MASRVSQGSGFQFGRKIASHGLSTIGNHLVSLLARKIAGEGRKRRKTNHVGTGTHKKRVGRPRVHHKAVRGNYHMLESEEDENTQQKCALAF